MAVTIKLKVKSCMECPYRVYGGEDFGEDFWECTKGKFDIWNTEKIDSRCPFKK